MGYGANQPAEQGATEFPAPPSPAEADLRSFPFMPMEVSLRDSDIMSHTSGDEFKAAMNLWWASWHQLPAGSLPDKDAELAKLAGFGYAVAQWMRVRTGALFGWFKCSDGRLYNTLIAKKVIEGWDGKLAHAAEKASDRLRKKLKREQAKNPTGQLFPPDAGQMSGGQDESSAGQQSGAGGNPSENVLIGKGTGKGTGKAHSDGVFDPSDGMTYSQDFLDAWALYPKRNGGADKIGAFKAWSTRLKEGATAEQLLAGTRRYAEWIRAEGDEGTRFVKMAATFYGPDKHFLEPYEIQQVPGRVQPLRSGGFDSVDYTKGIGANNEF